MSQQVEGTAAVNERLSRFLSLRLLLDPEVLEPTNRAQIAQALQAGKLVVIRDALKKEYAEKIHEALWQTEQWAPYETADGDFHFRHHNLYVREKFPPDLQHCRALFAAEDTKSLLTELSGRDCSANVAFGASWYMPFDYSLPHDDRTDGEPPLRQVAFLWHLTKDWDPRWGGHLYWGPAQRLLRPSFNTLYLFTIDPYRVHFVAPVAANAGGKRLTVNGWWYGADPYPPVSLPVDALGRVEAV